MYVTAVRRIKLFDHTTAARLIRRRFKERFIFSSLYTKLVRGAATCSGDFQRRRMQFGAENLEVLNHN